MPSIMKRSQAKWLQNDHFETLFWLDLCRDTGASFRETIVAHLKQKTGITIMSRTVEIRLRRLWAESSKKEDHTPGGAKLSFWDSVLKKGSSAFTLDPEVKARLTKRMGEYRIEVSNSGAADSSPSGNNENTHDLYGLDNHHSSESQSLRTQSHHPLENPRPRVLETQQLQVQQYLEERPLEAFQLIALEKVWNKELEEALERERKLRANEKRLEAANQHLSTALHDSQLARRDPQEYQNYLQLEREWKLNQEVHTMRKYAGFFQMTPTPLGPILLNRENLNKAIVELQFELEAIMVGHKMSTPLIVPPQVSNSDLGKLVHSAMATDVHSMSGNFWLTKWRLEPHAVVSALTISALRDWVFMSDFPNFEPDDLKILEATREAAMTLGGWTQLRRLNMAAYSLLIERDSFQTITIPRKATVFTNVLSKVLAPLFVKQGSRSDDPLFHTWGQQPDVYENRRDRVNKLFTIALHLKASTVLTDEDFEFLVHPLGTSNGVEIGENLLDAASNSQHESPRQQCWLHATIFTYEGRAESPRNPIRDAAVKLRNFVVKDEDARENCLIRKKIMIPRTSSSSDSTIGSTHIVVTRIDEMTGGTQTELENSDAVPFNLQTTSPTCIRNAPFECHICGEICQNERLLGIHKAKHGQSSVNCLGSQAQDSSQAETRFKASGNATIKYNTCELVWPDKRRLVNHMRTHGQSLPQASDRQPSNTSQATEQSSDVNNRVFICKECGEIFPNPKVLGAHVRWNHRESASNGSTQQRTNQGPEKAHIQSLKNRSMTCPVCGQVCQDKRGLITHTRCAHAKQPINSSLSVRMQSSKGFKALGHHPVKCSICEHVCKNQSGLLVHHRRVHKGVQAIRPRKDGAGKRVKCQLCPKDYSSIDSMQRHQRLKHQVPDVSLGCDKSPPESYLLQRPEETKSKEVTNPEAEVEGSRDCSNIVNVEPKVSLEDALHRGNPDPSMDYVIRGDVNPQTERLNAPTTDSLLLAQHQSLHPGSSHHPIEQHDHIGNEDEGSIEDESGMSDLLMDKTGLENDRPRLERASHAISTSNPKVKNSREIETVSSKRHAGEEIQGAGWFGNPKPNSRKRRALSVAGFDDSSKELEIRHAEKRLRRGRNNGNSLAKEVSNYANSQTGFDIERHESTGGNSSSNNSTVEREITPSETRIRANTHPADFSPPTGSLLRVELPGMSGLAGRFRSLVGGSSH